MNKLILVFILLFTAAMMFAAPASIILRDTTTGTRALVWLENPAYPSPTPTTGFAKWAIQYYQSTDTVIDPLSPLGQPTGDDVALTNAGGSQLLAFGPTGGFAPNAIVCLDPIATPLPNIAYHGAKIYARIFNAPTIAEATKSIVYTALYTVPSANATVQIVPAYAWSAWITHAVVPEPPAPAVYIAPANGSTTGYAPQTLSWGPGAGAAPTGYQVFFGTDNPPTVMVADQTATTYVTGPLAQLTTYYWMVVPYNVDGPAVGNVPWSFITRGEMNPNAAENPVPANGAVFAAPVPGGFVQTLSWSAPSTGVVPTGYKLAYMGVPPIDIGNVLTTDVLINGPGVITWQIIPYYVDNGMRVYGSPVETFGSAGTANVRGDAVGCPTWTFEVTPYVFQNYNVDITSTPAAPIFVNGVDSGFITPHTFVMQEHTSATYTVQLAGYTFIPAEFVVTDITANTSVNFIGSMNVYNFAVNSTPPGAFIYVDGVNSGFVTPHVFPMPEGSSAVYSVELPGWTFAPSSYPVNNIMAPGNVMFLGAMLMYQVHVNSIPAGAAVYVNGVNSMQVTPAVFTVNWGTIAEYSVQMAGYTWDGPFTVGPIYAETWVDFTGAIWTYPVDITSFPAGAAILVDGMPSGQVTPYQFIMNYGTSATYDVDLMGYVYTPANFVVTNIMAPAAQHFTGMGFGDGMIEPGIPELMVTPAGFMNPGPFIFEDPITTPFNIPYLVNDFAAQSLLAPILNPLCDNTNTFGVVLNPRADRLVVPMSITVPAGLWYVGYYQNSIWYPATPFPYMGTVAGVVTISVDPDLGPTYWYISTINPNVPVELSGFSAAVTASNYVSLTWVTESETQALGFNMYRAETNDFDNSYKVNTMIIPATNTSQQHTYNMIDDEDLVVGSTYYYWLESVDMTGMAYLSDPVNVTLTGSVTPPMPEISVMGNAYPNPFRAGGSTTINVDIKEGDTGTVTVYNLLGQVVKTYKVNAGQHNLTWDANGCASGIYFYKLSTQTVNSTKKLVIVN